MIRFLFWRVAGLSLACSAVLLPLLLASRPIGRRYSAKTCYFLWLLLALRLALPVTIPQFRQTVTVEVPQYEIELEPHTFAEPQPVPAQPQTQTEGGGNATVSAGSPAVRRISLTKLLPGLWLAGMLACGLWLVLSYTLVRQTLLKSAWKACAEDEALLGALARELGCRRCPVLYRSERVGTPMLLGLFRPVVLVPVGEPDQDGVSLMLRHELTHLRRHDVACKLLFQLACILHWFNPLVWWMGREAGRNLELCCDEDVVRGKDGAFRRSYGEVLLKTAAGRGRFPTLSARMGGGKGHLKARLGNLFIKKKNSGALVCIVLAAAILGGSLVSCTGEIPDKDWKAVVTSLNSSAEMQEELEKINALIEQLEQEAKERLMMKSRSLAVQELADSVTVTREGVLSFTIPEGCREDGAWQLELRGRMVAGGIGGMSLHYGFDPAELEPGTRYTHDLSEQWAGITELYLSVALREESMVIDLLTDAASIVPSEWADGLSVGWYIRDAGGFGVDFYILLRANGTFEYYEGGLSSYIGMGTWSCDGETLCLADRVLENTHGIQYYYFKVAEGALIFQAEDSAEFMYLDVADGERFSLKPRPGYFAPDAE